MKLKIRWLFFLILSAVFAAKLNAQVEIQVGTVTGATNGQTIVLPVTVKRFATVAAVQFTVQWNPAVLQFQVLQDIGLTGFTGSSYATNLAGSGKFTVSWDDTTGAGLSLADGAKIFGISFKAIGTNGMSSEVKFVDDPTSREVVVDVDPVPSLFVAGSVAIGAVAPPANTPPIAFAQTGTNSVMMLEDVARAIVLAGFDVDTNALTYTVVSQPTKGVLSGTAPDLTYTPNSNVNGSDSFTFTVSDGMTNSSPATVSISITAVNDAPVAVAQSVSVKSGVAKAIVLAGTDVEGASLTYAVVTQPTKGGLSGTAPNLTYTPNAGVSGSDSFTFRVNDGALDSAVATVSLTIQAASTGTAVEIAMGSTNGIAPGATVVVPVTVKRFATVAAVQFTVQWNPAVLQFQTLEDIGLTGFTGASYATNLAGSGKFTVSWDDTTGTGVSLADGGKIFGISFKAIGTNGMSSEVKFVDDPTSREVVVDVDPVPSLFVAGSVAIGTVAPSANTPPIAFAQTGTNSVVVIEDVAKAIVLGGFDADTNSLTYAVVTQPTKGVLSGTVPNLTYTPNANVNGSDSFTFTVSDDITNSSPATVSISITPVNDAPVAFSQTGTNSVVVLEDLAKAIVLSGFDVDGSALTYTVLSQPTKGVLSGTVPNLTYTPNANINGSDSFTFVVNDGATNSAAATVSINITSVNDVPVAVAQSVSVNSGAAKAIVLAGTDVEGSTLAYAVVTQPTKGVLSGTAPNLTYTPNSGVSGSDSFTFKVNDGALDSAVATVLLTIQAAPTGTAVEIAMGSTNGIAPGSTVVVPVTVKRFATVAAVQFTVQWNPAVLQFQALEDIGLTGFTGASYATNLAGSGKFTVSWDDTTGAGVSLADGGKIFGISFKAIGTNGMSSEVKFVDDPTSREVVVDVDPVASSFVAGSVAIGAVAPPANTPPIAFAQTGTNSVVVIEDVAKAIVLGGFDADTNSLTYAVVTQPTKGVLSGTVPNLTYTPNANVNGSDSFTFTVSDGITNSSPATVSISITSVNDVPVAVAQSVSVNSGVAKAIVLAGTDVEGASLAYAVVTQPMKGVLSGTVPNLTYTPNANINGSDSFTFTVGDGITNSLPATVSIVISPVNDAPPASRTNTPPVALSVVRTNVVQEVIGVYGGMVPLVFAGSDADGDQLNYRIVSASTREIFERGFSPKLFFGGNWFGPVPTGTLNEAEPRWYFRADQVGTYRFNFVLNDGSADSAVANLDMVVVPLGPEGAYTEITPMPNAVNVSPRAEIVIRHRDGTLPWTADNVTLKYDGQTVTPTITKEGVLLTIRYTPPVISPSGVTHSVILGHLDPQGMPSTYEYGFTTRVYNRPVALAQSITTNEDLDASVMLTGSDLDGDGLTYSVVIQPKKGTLIGSGASLTYRPSANANGTDSFTFKVNDGTLDSEPATVSIVIAPVNDAPIALAGTFQTSKNVAKPISLAVSDPDIFGSFSVVEGNFSWRQARTNAESRGGHLATFTSQGEWDLAKAVVGQRSLWIGAYQGENRVEPAGGWLWVTGEPWGFTAWGPGEPNNVGSEDFAHLIYTPMVNSPTWNDAPENSFYARSYLLEMPSAELNQGLTFTIVTPPTNGSLSGTPPNLTYTPRAGFVGSDAFTFRVGDGAIDSSPATVSISVVDLNTPPVALSMVITNVIKSVTQPNGPMSPSESQALLNQYLIPLVFSGSDADGNPLTYRIVSAREGFSIFEKTSGGGYSENPYIDGGFGYTPTGVVNEAEPKWYFRANLVGTYRFQFVVRDGLVDSAVANLDMVVVAPPQTPAANRAPVAVAGSFSTAEDTSVPITLKGSDADGNALTFSVVAPPTQGVLTGTAPNLTYTPNTNANGSDSFRFKVNDGYVDSPFATVSITIAPVADAPVATSATIVTDEDVPVAVVLNGSDPDLVPTARFTVVEGTFTWTQARTNAESRGGYLATFTSQAEWDLARTVVGERSLWIGGYQGASRVEPAGGWLWVTGEPWSFTAWGPGEPNNAGPEDFAHLIYTPLVNASTWNDAPDNFYHPQGYLLESPSNAITALTFTVVVPPTKGVLSGVAPNLTYTPNPDANGTDGFSFKVNDGTSDSPVATVAITIRAVNDAPRGETQSLTLNEDSSASITLRGSDAEGDATTLTVFTEPAKGTLSGTPPNLIYTPNTNATGSDAFVFKVDDGSLSSFATISINIAPINDPPVALSQSVTLSEDASRTITLRGSDIDTPSALLVYTILTPPTKGSLVGTNGVYTYRPNAHANGPDGFTFKVSDGSADSAPAAVSIDITPVNDAPLAVSQGVSTIEDGPVAVTLAGIDADSDPLAFTIVNQPINGSLSGTPPNLTYIPRTNFAGVDSFSFKVSDGVVESPTNGVVSITITPVNDAPVAVAQSISTPKNTPRPIVLGAADAENDALTYTVVSQPTRGALAGTAPVLTYTPELNFVGNDSFTFRARDGADDSAIVTVSIRVVATNVAPVALAQSVSVAEDTGLPVLLGATDADLDPLTFTVVVGPTKGTLSGTPPNLVYLPNTNAFGADTFTFLANDGAVVSAPATVSLTITPINDAPVAQAAAVSGPEDSVIPVLLTALDVDGDALEYTVVGSPSSGTLIGTPPALSYIPPTNFHGTDTLRFKVRDGAVDSAVVTVQLTVTPVNDPPILAPLAGSVLDAGVGLYFNAAGSDIDLPAQTLTFSLKSGPAGMAVSSSGSVSWLPTGSQRPSTNTVVLELTDGSATVAGSFVVVAKEASLVANFEGSAIDGYIAGATLWFDADLDGVVDPGEPQTVTDRQGDFVLNFDASLFDTNRNGKLDPSEGRIVAEGGVDLSSGQPRVGQLTAPAGSSVITPLTTMVDLVSREGAGLSVAVAEERVRTSLGIPAGISINSYDPVAAAVQGDQRASAVQLAASTVADTIRLLASAVDGSSAGVDAQTSSAIVSQTLAKKMVAGTEVDLASTATVSSALSQAAFAAGTSVSAEVAKAVSAVVADQNLAKESIVANAWNPLEALQSISQVQAVAQSSTANALSDLASGVVSTDEVLLVHTGNALSAAVAAAPVGDVTGTDRRPGTFTISTATAVVSEAGQVIQPLIIARQNGAFGPVRLNLRLAGDADLLKTNSILVEFADAVTQRTVDLASVLRDDLDPQFDRLLSASLALAPNAPTGAVLGSAVSASIRVVDNDAAGSIGFVASTFRASEAGEVTVELRRVDGSAGRIRAVVRLFGGSAAPGQDYTNSVITTEFLSGQTRKRVSLGWIDDATAESSETVNATLEVGAGSAPGVALVTGSTEAVVTVDDNDAPNLAPVATGVAPGTTLTVVEGSSISLTLLGTDPEGASLNFTPVGVPSKGVLSGRSPNLSYKANLGARGTDSFTYKVNDGQLDSSLTTVTITIKPINLAPTATGQIVSTEEGRTVGLRLAGTDPDGDTLTFRVTRAPSKGVLSGIGGELVYTPNAFASGVDSFLFRANDSKDESPDQTVWVVISEVNDAPVANSQTISGLEDQPLVITLTGNDPEGSSLIYTLVQTPTKGVLSGTGSRLIYLPSTNYQGADAFTFRVSDGSLSSGLATVSVSILPVNDAPEAFGQTLVAVVGTPAPIVLTGRDLESDPLRFTVVRPPAQGTLSGIPPNLSYTAASGARGADSFTFKVGDGSLESAESTVAIQLAPENVAPSAVAQSVVVDEGSTRSINLTGVDPEGAPLTYSIVSAPAKGTLSGTAPGLVYTSIAGKTGADAFTFKVNDGFRDSALAVVSLDIRENQIPTASAQSVTLAEDTTRSIVLSGLDPEAKPLTYKLVSPPSKGELSGTAPNLTYTPRSDVSGSDSFSFRVNDGVKDSAVALVSLTITEVNDAPLAVGFSSESANRAPVTLQLSGTDVDSTVLTYTVVQQPALGSLSGQAPNLVYTPRTNAFGTDSFTYTVSDGTAVSEPAVVTIPIKLPVTIPVAVAQKLEAEDGVPLSIILSGTDTSGLPLTYLVDIPASGTLTASGPNVVYTAKPGFRGRDVFGFRVFNGVRYSSSALVEVQVVAKRDKPPVFDAIANVTLDEGQSLTLAVKATDPEGAKLVYSLDRGPSGLTVSPTGAVAWVPSEAQGPSTNLVIVGVDDGVNFVTRRFTVVVREVNSAPEIDPLAAVSIDPLVPWTLSLGAKDFDLPAQRLVFGLVQGPEGLSVSETGRITWVPTTGQASKTHRVEVFVTDGAVRATVTFQVTVRAPNTAPFFSNLTSRLIRELNPTSFRLVGRDADLPAQQLTFGLVAGPQGLTVSTNGQVSWTPTEEQGPSTNRVVVRVSDSGVPALSTTNSFDIIVTEANVAPTFVSLTSRLIRELSPISFRLVGRDSDLPAQLLTYSLVSGPSGLTVSPEGVVAWTPTEEQGPSTNAVTVRVSDNGSSPLSAASTFNLIVSEVNTAPTVINAFSRSMVENVKLTSQLIARDGDLPAQKLTFSLVSGPRGLTLSAGGLLEWTPAEDQGPSTNQIVVQVSDDAPRSALSTVTFSVTVREANSPPVFSGTNLNVAAQSKLASALQATDSDLPAQILSYRLEGGPAGLTISTNGLLEWTPPANFANTTNVVRVSVTDSQVRVQTTIRIVVGPVGSGTGSEAKSLARTLLSLQIQPDQSMVLKVAGPAGARFRVESTARLGGDWRTVDSLGVIQTLGEDVALSVPVPSDESEGFRQFRLVKE